MSSINQLAERIFAWQHRIDPFLATQQGIHSYDDLVPEITQHALQEQIKTLHEFQNQLFKVNRLELDIHQEVNWQLADIYLKHWLRTLQQIRLWEKDPGYIPSKIMSITYYMLSRDYAPIQDRLEKLAKRLELVPQMLLQSRFLIKNPPYEFTTHAIKQCRHGGLRFFKQHVPTMIESQGGVISPLFQRIINQVTAAFLKHLTWLESILPQSHGKFAIGTKIFNDMLKEEYLMSYSVDTLIAKGWELLHNTEHQMEKLAQSINPNKSWEDIIEEMKTNHPSADQLLSSYRQELQRAKQFVIDKEIVELPLDEELIVIETPLHMRALFPYAGYSGSAVFAENQSGRLWVTPVDPESTATEQEQKLREHMYYKLPVFVLHEGYPGHHLQISTAHRLPETIRKVFHNNLYCEGWAFYCEELMEQLGFITEPKTRLSRLKDQLWRASRIIIDASLHSEQMSFNQAVDFLVDRAHLERSNAIAEVNRYIKNPLRPMSYLMGKLEIMSIAKLYKQQKQNNYSLKKFHNHLLSLGAIPPSLVKKELLNI